jgi:uncharacterized membrane protein
VLQSPIWLILSSALALHSSLVLFWRGMGGPGLPGCKPGSSCDKVISSRWGKIGRVPVALPAAAVYMVTLSGAATMARESSITPLLWMVLTGLVALSAEAAIWFMAIQIFVLRRICFYCTIAHVAAIGSAFLLAGLAPDYRQLIVPAAAGTVAAVALILAQILVPGKTYELSAPQDVLAEPVNVGEQTEEFKAPAPPSVSSPSPPSVLPRIARPSRRIALLGGRLSFDIAIFPILGSPSATHVIADVMDYTCEHCRAMHPMLQAALDAFERELAILAVPAPLEPACNPMIRILDPRYANACTYWRLALAMWQIDPARFPSFHHWLLEGENPPSIDAAKERAAELTGTDAVAAAMTSPKVQEHLSDGLTIYRLTGAGQLPKLLLPGDMLRGQVSSSAELISVLRGQLRGAGTRGPTQQPVMPVAPPARPSRPSTFSDKRIG